MLVVVEKRESFDAIGGPSRHAYSAAVANPLRRGLRLFYARRTSP
jgi:hypothetical protein